MTERETLYVYPQWSHGLTNRGSGVESSSQAAGSIPCPQYVQVSLGTEPVRGSERYRVAVMEPPPRGPSPVLLFLLRTKDEDMSFY